jgi:hypothetical protein
VLWLIIPKGLRCPCPTPIEGCFDSGLVGDATGKGCPIRELDDRLATIDCILINFGGLDGLPFNLGAFDKLSRHIYLLRLYGC